MFYFIHLLFAVFLSAHSIFFDGSIQESIIGGSLFVSSAILLLHFGGFKKFDLDNK